MKMWITEENPSLKEAYRFDNYILESTGGGITDICIIYFSGNNIYFPNNEGIFYKTIIENNRYEWMRQRMEKKPGLVYKEIFVRDIYKQWYVKGISDKTPTIDDLVDLLKHLTSDSKSVLTVGNSAGGYAAALVGGKLGVDAVFDFSGQFDLTEKISVSPILKKYSELPRYSKYFNITDVIEESGVPVYYFWPAKAGDDILQADKVKKLKNVRSFSFSQKTHGKTMYTENLSRILSLDKENLDILYKKYQNNIISPFRFSVDVSGITVSMKAFCMNLLKNIKHRLSHRGSTFKS